MTDAHWPPLPLPLPGDAVAHRTFGQVTSRYMLAAPDSVVRQRRPTLGGAADGGALGPRA